MTMTLYSEDLKDPGLKLLKVIEETDGVEKARRHILRAAAFKSEVRRYERERRM